MAQAPNLDDVDDSVGLLRAILRAQSSNSSGETPFLSAARYGHCGLIESMLKSKADVNGANDQGATALIASSIRGHTKLVKLLIENKASVNHLTKTGDSAISLATWKNRTETALVLIDNGADLTRTDRYGDNVLHDASKHGNPRLIKRLIETKKIDVNKANTAGATPLLNAVRAKHLETVKLLLEARAIVTNPVASTAASTPELKELVEKYKGGVIPSIKDEAFLKHIKMKKPIDTPDFLFGEAKDTCLILAARAGKKDMVEGMISNYPEEVNKTNAKQSTPLIAAAMRGHSDVCEMLLEAKAQISARTKKGDSALSLAIWKNHTETAELLLDGKADPTTIDSHGDTPLHDLARIGNIPLTLKVHSVLHNPNFKPGGDKKAMTDTTPRDKANLHMCAKCGEADNKLKNCSACKSVAYCSVDCQRAHWKQHKPTCMTKRAKGKKKPVVEAKKVKINEPPKRILPSGGDALVRLVINTRSRKDVSPLLCALQNKKKAMVKLLLELNAEITDSELYQAYREKEMREIIEKELERRSKSIFESETDEQFVNRVKETRTALLPVTGRFEAPPVVWIAAHGNVEALSAIFEYSPSSIGAKDKRGWGALLSAAQNGRVLALKYILSKSKPKTVEAIKALGVAVAQEHTAAAMVLLSDSVIDSKMIDESPLLAMAVSTANHAVLEEMLEIGADVNKKDSEGNTPLHLALSAETPADKIICCLLDYGAKVDSKALSIAEID